MTSKCEAPDCEKPYIAKKRCSRHYWQFSKHGRYLTKEDISQHKREAAYKRETSFKKGHTPWHKGMKMPWSEEHIQAIKAANTGRPGWNKGTKGVMPRPHNKIGDGVTAKEKLLREEFRTKLQKVVFERDDYTCQICDERGNYLQVDHIKGWSKHPELRFELDNCRTLCMACHYYITFKRKIPEGIIWGHNLSRRIAS